jgi:hypothetical protein
MFTAREHWGDTFIDERIISKQISKTECEVWTRSESKVSPEDGGVSCSEAVVSTTDPHRITAQNANKVF